MRSRGCVALVVGCGVARLLDCCVARFLDCCVALLLGCCVALLPARPVDLRARGEGVVEYPGKVACPSGRRCSTRNAVWCHSHPGFKSQRYRHCRPAPLGPGGFVMPEWVCPRVSAACCCLWLRWCSGRRRPRPLCVPVGGGPPASRPRREPPMLRVGACGAAGVLGAVGPGRPRDRHTRASLGVVDLEARPCPPVPPAPSTPVGLGVLTCACASARSPAVPSAPSGALHTGGAGSLMCALRVDSLSGQAPPLPINFARNSPAACSNIECASLELQRFWGVSKNDHDKLRATFGQCGLCCRLRVLGSDSPAIPALVIPEAVGVLQH